MQAEHWRLFLLGDDVAPDTPLSSVTLWGANGVHVLVVMMLCSYFDWGCYYKGEVVDFSVGRGT